MRGQHGVVRDEEVRNARQTFRELGVRQAFHRGDVLMRAGEPSTEVLLIETGAVKVVLSAENGTESVANICGPGELIGEMGVAERRPRSATVIAYLDGVATHVSAVNFHAALMRHHELMLLLNHTLQDRLQRSDRTRLAFAAHDASTRVGWQLLEWARVHGRPVAGGLLVTGLSQRDVAQVVAASVKHVEAVYRALRSAELLRTGRRWYLLPAPDVLERFLATRSDMRRTS